MGRSKKEKQPWRNRIVGYGDEDPEQLLANPANYRIHPKAQQDALRDVLNDVGIVDDVIVNRSTGFLVDGHLRVTLALREGQSFVPVKYVELTEEEEAKILLTFDPLSAMAAIDAKKLDELLREVQVGGVAIQEMLTDMAQEAGLYMEVPELTEQKEPELKGDCFIEIYCSSFDLGEFRAILNEWSERESVTINIS